MAHNTLNTLLSPEAYNTINTTLLTTHKEISKEMNRRQIDFN